METLLIRYKRNVQIIILIACIGVLASVVTGYFNGNSSVTILYKIFYWFSSFAIALLVNKVCMIIQIHSTQKLLNYLPFLIFLNPLFYLFDYLFFRNATGRTIQYYMFSSALILLSEVFIIIFVTSKLSYKRTHDILSNTNSGRSTIEHTDQNKEREKENSQNIAHGVLGRGKSTLDNVITATLLRASASNRIISFSLIAMVVIVLVGGFASFGTIALNEAKKIRELEIERTKLVNLTNLLSNTGNIKYVENNRAVKAMITDEYGDEKTYTQILQNIEKRSYISWPDIAMRISIAALTLFLVQIFFHIYKYNQLQASQLFNKAEMLELHKDQSENLENLRNGLLSKMNMATKFEKEPSTPTEKIINIVGDSKGS